MTPATTHELLIKRTFNAPRQAVWKAWTEQARLVEWFSPKDFVTLNFDMEFRVGGTWTSSIQSPAGEIYTMIGSYLEISEPDRLVFTHGWEDSSDPGYLTTVTVELEERNGETEMTLIQAGFKTTDGRDQHYDGWDDSLDKLVAMVHRSEGKA